MPDVIGISAENRKKREVFFKALFREGTGFICIASKNPSSKGLHEEFFSYPDDLDKALEYIDATFYGRNMYFCAQLLTEPQRTKKEKLTIAPTPVVWADLDACDPSVLNPQPSILVETSPGRHHGYWRLDQPYDPAIIEELSHRIAQYYKAYGVDSGWALTKLLRVPLTYNVNYTDTPVVKVVGINEGYFTPESFDHLPKASGFEYLYEPLPEGYEEIDPQVVLKKYETRLSAEAYPLFNVEPPNDSWSEPLWRLECLCFEAGMSRTEAFVVTRASACNKYARDNRSEIDLWREINKAERTILEKEGFEDERAITIDRPVLIQAVERRRAESQLYFVDKYAAWASKRTDAPRIFHEVSCLAALATVLSSRVYVPLAQAAIRPNLYVMLTGVSTIDRKSTAMDYAMDMLRETDNDAILATDATPEGLLFALSTRPGRSSLFWRDEVAGLLASMMTKKYMGDMPYILTSLYDGTLVERPLARGKISVIDPRVSILCGGTRDKVLEYLTQDHVMSGFLPRFVFVDSGDEKKQIMPFALTSDSLDGERKTIYAEFAQIAERYVFQGDIKSPNGSSVPKMGSWKAIPTTEALERFNLFNQQMYEAAHDSSTPHLFEPMFTRLVMSALKVATIIACIRQDPREHGFVEISATDMLRAIAYADRWRDDSQFLIEHVGVGVAERLLERIMLSVKRAGFQGVPRSSLMRNFHLDSRQANLVRDTLIDRGLIHVGQNKAGRPGEKFYSYESFRGE